MGGGPGAGAALIQAVLVMLFAFPTHLLAYRYLQIPSVVRWILTSLVIASIALTFPLVICMLLGGAVTYHQPLDEWFPKYFGLSLIIALLVGVIHLADLKK
ncbi:hypothetical protein [uncultured Gimesia sp.]|uniref:hypothetical protein n=1 Tax=uncultured Gimesia sp. TaxID=1678688 RepID=UPI0030D74C45|tara:strand:- start:56213 stop:56515 length:303 start_codon:yes stop_codon:yes gene_type:complete